jgi:hypothetical protein
MRIHDPGFLGNRRVVKYSDLLNRLSAKHGAKPSSPRPLKEESFKKPHLGVKLQIDGTKGTSPPGFVKDPTQEITRSTMERLFQTVLDTPADAQSSAPMESSPPETPPAAAAPIRPQSAKGFRNHAELLKFASVLINDIEDALKGSAG